MLDLLELNAKFSLPIFLAVLAAFAVRKGLLNRNERKERKDFAEEQGRSFFVYFPGGLSGLCG
jgi:hypothetical protein